MHTRDPCRGQHALHGENVISPSKGGTPALSKSRNESVQWKVERDRVCDALRSIQCGVDTIRSARSQELALITTHDDHAALEAYAVHPVHQEVVAWMKANCGGTVAVDFVETSDDA